MAARKVTKKSPKKAANKPNRKPARKAATKSAKAKVPRIPKGIHSVTPMLTFQDTAFAIQFYEQAFGAKELYRLTEPGGKVGHAEVKFGDSVIMMADEYPDMAILSAKTIGGSPVRLSLAFKNVDAAFARAVAAGATVIRPLTDEFYGWRSGNVMDPFSPREMQKRWTRMLAASKLEGAAA